MTNGRRVEPRDPLAVGNVEPNAEALPSLSSGAEHAKRMGGMNWARLVPARPFHSADAFALRSFAARPLLSSSQPALGSWQAAGVREASMRSMRNGCAIATAIRNVRARCEPPRVFGKRAMRVCVHPYSATTPLYLRHRASTEHGYRVRPDRAQLNSYRQVQTGPCAGPATGAQPPQGRPRATPRLVLVRSSPPSVASFIPPIFLLL